MTINGKFYKGIDGYMIAGPQFSNYMAQVAPAYGTNPFPAPPSNMLNAPAAAPAPGDSARRRAPRGPRPAPAPAPDRPPAPSSGTIASPAARRSR